MDLVNLDEVIEIIAKTHYEPLYEKDPVVGIVADMVTSQLCEVKSLPKYNPVSQMDKLKSELSEILESYEYKQKGVEVDCSAFTKKILDAYRYAKASVDIAEFEKKWKEAPKFIVPTPKTKKFRVWVGDTWLTAKKHDVIAEAVSMFENKADLWIGDAMVGHFEKILAVYKLGEDDESDTNRE